MVGARGFEPRTSWSRTKRATRLRYAPNSNWPWAFLFLGKESLKERSDLEDWKNVRRKPA